MYVQFDDIGQMVAAGDQHSLILTRSGYIYSFGANSSCQLGVPVRDFTSKPQCIKDIIHIPMCFVAAGSYSACISTESRQLYIWGKGEFGELAYPHRVKTINEPVVSVSLGENFGVALTENQEVYTWGENQKGQLGNGSCINEPTPQHLQNLDKADRVITSISCGHSFTLTLSQHRKIADDIFQSTLYHSKVAQMQESQ